MSQYFAHYKIETGEILGILNRDNYARRPMPTPNLAISSHEADKIVARPAGFKIQMGKLVALPEPRNDDLLQDKLSELKRESVRRKQVGIVDKDGVCYMSDDAAVIHLNTVLAFSKTPGISPKLHVMIDGRRSLKEVTLEKAQSIAVKIYELRCSADEEYFIGCSTALDE